MEKEFRVDKPSLNIAVCTLTFYALEWLDKLLEEKRFSRAALLQLSEEVKAFRHFFEGKFARALFDYLAFICFGEARWSACESWGPLSLEIWQNVPASRLASRWRAYRLALNYDPSDFLPKLERLFTENEWLPSFGGENWARIAAFAQKFGGELSNWLFVDGAVSLQHNTGCPFNKGVIFERNITLHKILDYIFEEEPSKWLQQLSIGTEAAKFFRRAKMLGLRLPEVTGRNFGEFPKVPWGKKKLKLITEGGGR